MEKQTTEKIDKVFNMLMPWSLYNQLKKESQIERLSIAAYMREIIKKRPVKEEYYN